MKYHFIYAWELEQQVLEIDTDDVPPNIGDDVQLPFGENKEIRLCRALDVYYAPISPEKTIYFIEVKPVENSAG
jgi:hypothetical protein